MASKFNLVVRLQHWMDSIPGQTFLNYAYSWGASVVILGALFKLTHLPGGNLMLFLGMGTEAFVFFLAAFDRPFDKNADKTELAADFETDEEIERAEALAAARRMGVADPVYMGGAPAVGGAPVAVGVPAEDGAPAAEGTDVPVAEVEAPAVAGGAPAVIGGGVIGGAPAVVGGVVGGAPVGVGGVDGGAPAVVGGVDGGAPAVVGGIGGGASAVVAGGAPAVIGGGVVGGAPVVIGGGAVVSGTAASTDETSVPLAPASSEEGDVTTPAAPAAGETYEEPLRAAVGQMYDTTEGRAVIEQEAAKLAEIIRMANDELLHRAQAVLSPEMEEATEDYIEKLKTLNETLAKVDEQSARLTRDSQEMENLNRTLIGINKVYDLHFASISRQVTTIEDINRQTTQLAAKIEEVNNIYTRMMMQLGVLVNPMGAAVTGAATTPQPAYGQPAYGQPAYAQPAPAAQPEQSTAPAQPELPA